MRAALLVAALTLGCGARTALIVDETESDAITVDSASDVVTDSATDTEIDSGVDAPLTDVGCATDFECDDGVSCTRDVCELAVGRCRNIPENVRCDDGLFCTGTETCDPTRGCVTTPRACADPVACTEDVCDESRRECLHQPNDALCPISHGCDVMLGCQARAIAHTRTELYEIRLPAGVISKIGPTGDVLTDIALHPTGTLYGVTSAGLCVVELKSGKCGSITSLSGSPVGLDAAPDGTLYGAAGSIVYSINRTTGLTTTVARFPPSLQASGDLAFLSTGRLLGTARGAGAGGDDSLVEFDLKTATSKSLGKTGFNCIWGLAAYGPTLYGLTCEGRVLFIDPVTAKATELSRISVEFWGATAR